MISGPNGLLEDKSQSGVVIYDYNPSSWDQELKASFSIIVSYETLSQRKKNTHQSSSIFRSHHKHYFLH